MIQFGNHNAFWLLWGVLALIIFYFWAERKKTKLLAEIGDLELMKKLTESRNKRLAIIRMILFIFAYIFLVLAIARPQLGTGKETVKREGIDIVVALDVSRSMLAEDISPSRLSQAKYELKSLIERLKGDRIGIVAFAGDAFLACPLTTDYSAALMLLDALGPDAIPEQGTVIQRALQIARRAFVAKDNRNKVIILITDGEDHEGDAVAEAEEAKNEGIRIYAIGIGSTSGVPIPLYDNTGRKVGMMKDRAGTIVTTRLEERVPRAVAMATNGAYYHASPGGKSLREILREIDRMEKSVIESKVFTNFEERYYWALIPALVLLFIAEALPERKISIIKKRKRST